MSAYITCPSCHAYDGLDVDTFECSECGYSYTGVKKQIAELERKFDESKNENEKLRQQIYVMEAAADYPTKDAYEAACKALWKHRDRVAELESKLEMFNRAKISVEELSNELRAAYQKIADLKMKKFANFNGDECWIYDREADNRLDSLVCPVVISASDLSELENKLAGAHHLGVDMNTNYLIGQRVIVDDEIGTVVRSETGETNFGVWVYLPSRRYASDYSLDNVKPLPNGQL